MYAHLNDNQNQGPVIPVEPVPQQPMIYPEPAPPTSPPRSFAGFMKANKLQRQNVRYAATKYLLDDQGRPLEWELRPLTTAEDDKLRDGAMRDTPVKGKPGMVRPKLDTSLYLARMLAAMVVYPNLLDAELQDSYGVKKPEDLVRQMVDEPGEYQDFSQFATKLNGFNTDFEELVDEAKN